MPYLCTNRALRSSQSSRQLWELEKDYRLFLSLFKSRFSSFRPCYCSSPFLFILLFFPGVFAEATRLYVFVDNLRPLACQGTFIARALRRCTFGAWACGV